ncbi:MAG: hypothetical protein P4L57_13500, partial [Rhizomicrobium sp.]|nr:hypothetical protein [Rhizomicrobium sp.]
GIGKMLLEIARFRASIRPNPAKSNTCRRTEKSNGATHSVFLTDDYIDDPLLRAMTNRDCGHMQFPWALMGG